jgi:helicase
MTAVKLRDALRAYDKTKHGEFGFLHAISATPDMLPLYLRRTDNDWLEGKVSERSAELLLPMPSDLEEYEFFLAEVKTACVLDDWLQEMEEEALLEKYTIGPGDLHNKVEIGEWLLYSMRELSNIFNREAYPPLTELMTRVRYGVRRELLDLVKLRNVGRARARSLFNNGVRTIDDVRAAELGRLARIPKIGDVLAKSLKEQVGDSSRQKRTSEAEAKSVEVQTETKIEKDAKTQSGQRKLMDF